MSDLEIQILNLGLIEYEKAHQIQIQINQNVKLKKTPPTIIVCSHHPIVTLGKRSKLENLNISWKGKIINIERGGQATYHGPGQLIIYPIIPINEFKLSIESFLNVLECSIIDTLKKFQIIATGNSDRGNPKYTGVWVKDKKIASIGIALKRWVSYHGLAINLERDSLAFTGINPCGFTANIMTSVEEVLNKKINRNEIELCLSKMLCHYLRNSL